jgi:hypothetical protein
MLGHVRPGRPCEERNCTRHSDRQCEEGQAKRNRSDIEFFKCAYCPDSCEKAGLWPDTCFEEARLNEWKAAGALHLMQCSACSLQAKFPERGKETVRCISCRQMRPFTGPPQGFSATFCRQMLDGNRMAHRAVCYECQYPRCSICKGRPDFPPPHNSGAKHSKIICEKCRFPPCAGCHIVARPAQTT